jgi:hypothetical protein
VEVAPKRLPFFRVSKNLTVELNGGRAKPTETIRGQDPMESSVPP